jgi:hypothetical protein
MTPQQIWQSQSAEAPRISLEYVRHHAMCLERRTRWRNAVEYGGSLFAFGFAGWTALKYFTAQPIMLTGLICCLVYVLYYVFAWRRLAGAQSSPAEAGVFDTLRYQRRQLERQRDARRHYLRRFGLPLLPGYVLIIASMVFEYVPARWDGVGYLVANLVVIGGLGAWAVEREARRFQRAIDALNSLNDGS